MIALPDEERAHAESYDDLVRRLSRLSVTKHYDAYADVDWDCAAFKIVDGKHLPWFPNSQADLTIQWFEQFCTMACSPASLDSP